MICGIESVYPVDDLRMPNQLYLFIVMSQYTNSHAETPFGIFSIYVILTISYLRAQTIETSSLPIDSSRPLFEQIEIFSSILTAYLNCKYCPQYTCELLGCLLGISPPGEIPAGAITVFTTPSMKVMLSIYLNSSTCSYLSLDNGVTITSKPRENKNLAVSCFSFPYCNFLGELSRDEHTLVML